VLGHKLQGVEGVYNVHDYFDEKAEALQKLATFVDDVVSTCSVAELPLTKPQRVA
jgi:hypothetical protein